MNELLKDRYPISFFDIEKQRYRIMANNNKKTNNYSLEKILKREKS
ncbi:MAG: hypothetical protein MR270_07890 [Erysipelotrichaceae bacterium]|nr:hypothetical protein [Erysipelotrichaceae bacterium]